MSPGQGCSLPVRAHAPGLNSVNTGLRQWHHTAIPPRPKLDGDLERELHQHRTQLDAHPVSRSFFLQLQHRAGASDTLASKRENEVIVHFTFGALSSAKISIREMVPSRDHRHLSSEEQPGGCPGLGGLQAMSIDVSSSPTTTGSLCGRRPGALRSAFAACVVVTVTLVAAFALRRGGTSAFAPTPGIHDGEGGDGRSLNVIVVGDWGRRGSPEQVATAAGV